MRVVIFQADCRDYRVGFFRELSFKCELTLIHFGTPKFNLNPRLNEIQASVVRIFGFYYLKNYKNYVANADVVILPFDVHWLNIFCLSLYKKCRVVLWGHGLGRNTLVRKVKVSLINRASSVITYSEKGAEDIEGVGISKDKIFIAYNTLEVLNSQDLSCADKDSIIYVGR